VSASPRTRAEVKDIWSVAEYILAPHNAALAPHELVITPASLATLLALGVPLQVEPDDVQSMINASREAVGGASREHAALGMFGPWFAKVQQLDAINAYLDELVSLSNGRAKLSTIGNSLQGRPIKAVRISSTAAGTERAGILVTGTQHAREWASPMVTMGLVDALIRRYDLDPDVKKVVDALDVYIIPVVNPDGYVATYNGKRLQRKNMNPKCNVDLNRNWDIWWGMGTPVNGCNEETYPGTAAFSEPETLAMKQFTSMHKQIKLCFDYHSAAQQVGYPFAFNKSKPTGYDKEKAWAGLYSDTLKSVNGNVLPAVEDYDTLGSSSRGKRRRLLLRIGR